jgi:hypothetical protein
MFFTGIMTDTLGNFSAANALFPYRKIILVPQTSRLAVLIYHYNPDKIGKS